jgi:hypothetical protein
VVAVNQRSRNLTGKVSQGQPLGTHPFTSARAVNDLMDIRNAHRDGLLSPRPHSGYGPSTVRINIKNMTGGNLKRGHVVQLDDALVVAADDASFNPDLLWFKGKKVAGAVWSKLVVVAQPMRHNTDEEHPDNQEIGPAVVDGLCTIRVRIADEKHTHAYPKADDLFLRSSYAGPFEILSKLTEDDVDTEADKEVVARFVALPQILHGKITSIVKRKNSAPADGKGKFQPYDYEDPSDLASALVSVGDELECWADWVVEDGKGWAVGKEGLFLPVSRGWKMLGDCPATQS